MPFHQLPLPTRIPLQIVFDPSATQPSGWTFLGAAFTFTFSSSTPGNGLSQSVEIDVSTLGRTIASDATMSIMAAASASNTTGAVTWTDASCGGAGGVYNSTTGVFSSSVCAESGAQVALFVQSASAPSVEENLFVAMARTLVYTAVSNTSAAVVLPDNTEAIDLLNKLSTLLVMKASVNDPPIVLTTNTVSMYTQRTTPPLLSTVAPKLNNISVTIPSDLGVALPADIAVNLMFFNDQNPFGDDSANISAGSIIEFSLNSLTSNSKISIEDATSPILITFPAGENPAPDCKLGGVYDY